MADREQQPNEEATSDQRSPITHDLDADGMDSEDEADEIEAGTGGQFDGNEHRAPGRTEKPKQ